MVIARRGCNDPIRGLGIQYDPLGNMIGQPAPKCSEVRGGSGFVWPRPGDLDFSIAKGGASHSVSLIRCVFRGSLRHICGLAFALGLTRNELPAGPKGRE